MQPKGYCVDHRLLRDGAANFSRSREARQDNDLGGNCPGNKQFLYVLGRKQASFLGRNKLRGIFDTSWYL